MCGGISPTPDLYGKERGGGRGSGPLSLLPLFRHEKNIRGGVVPTPSSSLSLDTSPHKRRQHPPPPPGLFFLKSNRTPRGGGVRLTDALQSGTLEATEGILGREDMPMGLRPGEGEKERERGVTATPPPSSRRFNQQKYKKPVEIQRFFFDLEEAQSMLILDFWMWLKSRNLKAAPRPKGRTSTSQRDRSHRSKALTQPAD